MAEQFFVEEKETFAESIDEGLQLLKSEFNPRKEAIALSTLDIDENYKISWNGKWHPMTRWALKSLLRMMAIPEHFGLMIPRDLLVDNVARLRQMKPQAVVVFLRGDNVLNIVRDGYFPAKNEDVLSLLQRQVSRWFPEKIRISDRGLWLTLLDEEMPVIEPKVGDVTKIALSLVNSETGGTSLKCSYSTYRLACLNGALMRDEWGSIRWSYDRRMKYDTSLMDFESALLNMSFHAESLIELYSRLPGEQLNDVYIMELWRAIERVVGTGYADMILEIAESDRKELIKTVRERWARNRINLFGEKEGPLSTDFNAYDVFNNITAAARDASYPVARQLERIGGRLIEVAAQRH